MNTNKLKSRYLDQLGDGLGVGVGDLGHLLGPPVAAFLDAGTLLGAEVLLVVDVRRDNVDQLVRMVAEVLAVGRHGSLVGGLHVSGKNVQNFTTCRVQCYLNFNTCKNKR